MMAKTPPITGAGIAARKAESFVQNPKIMNHTPAATNTILLATPVIEMIPAFVEYPVTGVVPVTVAIKQLRPSPVSYTHLTLPTKLEV